MKQPHLTKMFVFLVLCGLHVLSKASASGFWKRRRRRRRYKAPTACAAGHELIPQRPGCGRCPKGKAKAGHNNKKCGPCPRGQATSHVSGATSCVTCSVGKRTNAVSHATACLQCADGSYQNQVGQVSCKTCAFGTISVTTKTNCAKCPRGTKANRRSAATACANCGAGFYQNLAGQPYCKKCAAGQHTGGASRQSSCTKCFPGHYASSTGTSQCTKCTNGYYQREVGQSSCKTCASGKVSIPEVCQDINIGTGKNKRRKFAVKPGYVCPSRVDKNNWLTSDTWGDIFTTTRTKSSVSVIRTDGGNGHWGWDMNLRFKCCAPSNTNSANKGGIECATCPPGTKANKKSQATACANCRAGFYQHQAGTTSCNTCRAGLYQNQQRQTSCKKCAAGLYQNQRRQSSCKKCRRGTYTHTFGKTKCVDCRPGNIANRNIEATACKTCPKGWHQESWRELSCKKCIVGKSTKNKVGQPQCSLCMSGKYQNLAGNGVCKKCGPETRVNNGGAMITRLGETDSNECICDVDETQCRLPWGAPHQVPVWGPDLIGKQPMFDLDKYNIRFGYPGAWEYMANSKKIQLRDAAKKANDEKFTCRGSDFKGGLQSSNFKKNALKSTSLIEIKNHEGSNTGFWGRRRRRYINSWKMAEAKKTKAIADKKNKATVAKNKALINKPKDNW